jgi:hypothetical protein
MKLHYHSYPLVMANIAMENCPFIDGSPIKNGDCFHGKLLNNQLVGMENQ